MPTFLIERLHKQPAASKPADGGDIGTKPGDVKPGSGDGKEEPADIVDKPTMVAVTRVSDYEPTSSKLAGLLVAREVVK